MLNVSRSKAMNLLDMLKVSRSKKMKLLAQMLGLPQTKVASVDLVCGYTCPMALQCKSYADRKTGKVTDAKGSTFRCYGTSLEAAFPPTRALHWHNYDLLRNAGTVGAMTDILVAGLSDKLKVVRVHSFGDFFNENYFQAWLNTAEKFPNTTFFAYTKVLPYVRATRPDNFYMVYSYGGRLDSELTTEQTAYVVKDTSEAEALGVPVSCVAHGADDYNFIKAGLSFALLLHGVQPKKVRV